MMPSMSGPDYIVDISGIRPGLGGVSADQWVRLRSAEVGRTLRGRPWLAVRFRCCSVYSRVYRNVEGTAYAGACPKCGRRVRAQISSTGTDCRFFEAN